MSKKSYLTAYNATSAVLWLIIAINNVLDIFNLLTGSETIYTTHQYTDFPHKLLVYTQTLNAVVEISHSVLGVTKSPVSMTALQFFARCSITTGVCYLIPQSPGNFNPFAFPGLTIAWSSVEMIRYPYYVLKLNDLEVPNWLNWLRYSAFIVLYPLGLLSEPIVIYNSLNYVKFAFHYYFFIIGFSLYIPGFYLLYTYMWKQRGKVLKNGTKQSKDNIPTPTVIEPSTSKKSQ